MFLGPPSVQLYSIESEVTKMSYELISKDQVVNLEIQISRVIQRSLDRRGSVFVTPTLETRDLNYDGIIFSRKYRDLLTLSALIWYSDYFGDFKEYVIYEVEEYLYRKTVFPEIAAMLTSKSCFLYCLLCLSKYQTPNEIFGNILNPEQIDNVLKKVHLRMIKPQKVKKLVYRRGYKDKGTLPSSTSWLPKEDWTFDEEQLELERRREEYSDTVTRIVRASGDWVLKQRIFRKEDS
jgi:hypothetical protein